MQRRAYAPAAALAAAVLTTALAGCSGGSASGPGGDDSKPGQLDASASGGAPGKYHSLPEPCGYVSPATLRRMLPGTEDESEEEAERRYRGQATITYDTDRRVGCRWKLETPEGTRHLTVDFERVVSYQTDVSDEDRAQQLYGRLATAAHIPAAASASPSATSPSAGASAGAHAQGGAGAKAKGAPASGSPTPSSTGGSGTPGGSGAGPGKGSDAELAPRVLDDLGDDAFVDDELATTGTGVHRDIKVVFRSSNVLVTITYDQWSTDKAHIPSSADLQGKAHALARELDAGHFGN
ncbi:hypothetical protein WEB32_15955 [Streptomyces netropsis]|uniref:DUF3558 domain-containing protein n=1 Tax=Streptomyces netropsis TaxID=55404 RepID=A0A7W7LIL5_STRNE|nr:hypothetical protein [Streptomyces netropsis]MBB4890859.1 hypothetical protein [Streptomyces netropsis]GGR52391.1 hypothetical protein GCM10010219_66820 [Streptomyces netropsis]